MRHTYLQEIDWDAGRVPVVKDVVHLGGIKRPVLVRRPEQVQPSLGSGKEPA